MLLVIDAVTGNVLAKDTMPDGEETYCSAVVADLSGSGELKIIYGQEKTMEETYIWSTLPISWLMISAHP